MTGTRKTSQGLLGEQDTCYFLLFPFRQPLWQLLLFFPLPECVEYRGCLYLKRAALDRLLGWYSYEYELRSYGKSNEPIGGVTPPPKAK